MRFSICSMIYYIYFVKESRSQQILDMFFCINVLSGVIGFLLLDGMKMPYKAKQAFTILAALIGSYGCLHWTFLLSVDRISIKVHLWSGHSLHIDLTEWVASSMRIITIFVWKQAYYTIFQSPKSSVIQSPVKIVWLSDKK